MHIHLREFISEFVGTFLLLTIGFSGSATNVLGAYKTILCPAISYGIGLLIGASFSAPISGGHLNPAVTLSFAFIGKLSWRSVPVYVCAQYLGALLATATIYGIYFESIRALDANLTEQSATIFITSPAPHISVFPAALDQILSTAILVFAVLILSNQKCVQFSVPSQVLTTSCIIFSLTFAFNHNAAAIFNPARDLAPRLFLCIVGYRSLPFGALSGNFWWAVGIVGPHIGAIIGALLYEVLQKIRSEHHDKKLHVEPISKIRTIPMDFDSNNNICC